MIYTRVYITSISDFLARYLKSFQTRDAFEESHEKHPLP